ncbi:hypothetical protein J7T55_014713, partial [Diaporthe amygdali]|uniref:uncharacterized protein n=1 Tax=Phomopsis amygdali TaxID=1214568 RepID=UPI0022FE1F97
DLILRLCISYVFNQAPSIHEMLHFVVTEAREPLQTLGLPLPGRMIDCIDRHRQEAVQRIIDKYHGLTQYFTVRNCCSFECNSILLGSLLTAMVEQGLYFPMPARPFHGYSVAELISGVPNCSGLLGVMYVGLRNFDGTYFGDVADLDTASEAFSKQCIKGSTPLFDD